MHRIRALEIQTPASNITPHRPLSTSASDSKPSATNANEFPKKPAEHFARANPIFTSMPRIVDFVPCSMATFTGSIWGFTIID